MIYEALFHYPQKRRKHILIREEQVLKTQAGLGNLAGARQLLTPQTLFLSAARRAHEPSISAFINQFLGIQIRMTASPLFVRFDRPRFHHLDLDTLRFFDDHPQSSLFDDEEGLDNSLTSKEQALALLQLADLGIEDVTVDHQQINLPDGSSRDSQQVSLLHRVSRTSEPLDIRNESDGTLTWFSLIGPVLNALQHGTALLVDELDENLHPTLSAELLKLFHNPKTNPHGAQLIFTAHDTSLMAHLNRDEIWLTEKQDDGSTRLGPLSDFAEGKPRKSVSLEDRYLSGRFGAIPSIDQTDLLRSLGLIG